MTAEALENPERKPDQVSNSWARRRADHLNELPWTGPPPIRAQWEDLTGQAITETLALLRPQLVTTALADELESLDVQRIRSAPLIFYKNCSLVDLQLRRSGDNSERFVSALVTLTGAAILDGKSDLLHAINPYLLALTSNETASAYLRFYCTFVRGDSGPFQIVDEFGDLPNEAVEFLQKSQATREAISPLCLVDRGSENEEGWRRFVGCVLYGNALFQATFKVWDKGVVEIMDDQGLVSDLPVQGPRFEGIFRMS